MEWIPGEDLNELKENSITFDFVKKIKKAIDEINLFVFHNDIKPEHIKFADNQVRILDFDLATFKNESVDYTPKYSAYTSSGKPCHLINTPNPKHLGDFRGTIRYAPIDAHLGRPPQAFSDIESLYYVIRHLKQRNLPWSSTCEESGSLLQQVYEVLWRNSSRESGCSSKNLTKNATKSTDELRRQLDEERARNQQMQTQLTQLQLQTMQMQFQMTQLQAQQQQLDEERARNHQLQLQLTQLQAQRVDELTRELANVKHHRAQ